MLIFTVLLATASGGRQEEEEEELPNGGKGKAVADLPDACVACCGMASDVLAFGVLASLRLGALAC